MLKTLKLSFSLKNTYRVNSILYAIRQIPLVKRIIPSTVYQIRGFKVFANVLSVIWEILTVFLGKILYFLIMIVGAAKILDVPEESGAQFTFFTLCASMFGLPMGVSAWQCLRLCRFLWQASKWPMRQAAQIVKISIATTGGDGYMSLVVSMCCLICSLLLSDWTFGINFYYGCLM